MEVNFDIIGPVSATYQVNSKPDWVTVTRVSDTVAEVTVSDYLEVEERTGTVVFGHSSNPTQVTTTLKVTQRGLVLEVEPAELFVQYAGATVTLKFTVKGPDGSTWVYDGDADWVSVSANASDAMTAEVTVSPNPDNERRSYTLPFHHSANSAVTVDVPLTQERFFLIEAEPDSLEFYTSGGSSAVTVTLSGGTDPLTYNIVSAPDWLQAEKTSDSVMTVTVGENTGEELSGDIVLAHAQSEITTASVGVTSHPYYPTVTLLSVNPTGIIDNVPQELDGNVSLDCDLYYRQTHTLTFDKNILSYSVGINISEDERPIVNTAGNTMTLVPCSSSFIASGNSYLPRVDDIRFEGANVSLDLDLTYRLPPVASQIVRIEGQGHLPGALSTPLSIISDINDLNHFRFEDMPTYVSEFYLAAGELVNIWINHVGDYMYPISVTPTEYTVNEGNIQEISIGIQYMGSGTYGYQLQLRSVKHSGFPADDFDMPVTIRFSNNVDVKLSIPIHVTG